MDNLENILGEDKSLRQLISICQLLAKNDIGRDIWLQLLYLNKKDNMLYDAILNGIQLPIEEYPFREAMDEDIPEIPPRFFRECGFHCLRCNTEVKYFPRSITDHTYQELYCSCGSTHMFASGTDYEIVTDYGDDDYIDLSKETDLTYFEHIHSVRESIKD